MSSNGYFRLARNDRNCPISNWESVPGLPKLVSPMSLSVSGLLERLSVTTLPASLTFNRTRLARTHDIARVKPIGTSRRVICPIQYEIVPSCNHREPTGAKIQISKDVKYVTQMLSSS